MVRYDEYLKEVIEWNDEVKNVLESEVVDPDSSIWAMLDQLTDVLSNLKGKNLKQEDLVQIQNEVGKLNHEVEEYFTNRQNLGSIFINESFIDVGKHKLPPLPYEYNALEPTISEEIMTLHHTKHHQSYVNGLNKAEKKLEQARKDGDFSMIKHWSRELAFHGSGHYLHTIFWNSMSPKGGGKPGKALLKEIEKYFGSFEAFKKQFTEAAKQVEGVGWAILVWSPRSRHLEILQSERHMILTQWDTIPLLVLDVWEHAYYLQYKNNRADYIENWWGIVNWNNVDERFEKAKQLKWKAY